MPTKNQRSVVSWSSIRTFRTFWTHFDKMTNYELQFGAIEFEVTIAIHVSGKSFNWATSAAHMSSRLAAARSFRPFHKSTSQAISIFQPSFENVTSDHCNFPMAQSDIPAKEEICSMLRVSDRWEHTKEGISVTISAIQIAWQNLTRPMYHLDKISPGGPRVAKEMRQKTSTRLTKIGFRIDRRALLHHAECVSGPMQGFLFYPTAIHLQSINCNRSGTIPSLIGPRGLSCPPKFSSSISWIIYQYDVMPVGC